MNISEERDVSFAIGRIQYSVDYEVDSGVGEN